MVQSEVITIADAGHLAEDAFSAEVRRRDTDCVGEAAEASVEAEGEEDRGRQDGGGDDGSQFEPGRPVCHTQA